MGTGIVKTGHKEYCVLCACYTFQPVPGSIYNVNLTLLAERRTFASDAFLLKGMVHVNTMLVAIDVFNDGEKPPTTPKFSRKTPVYFLKDKVQVQDSQGAQSGIFKVPDGSNKVPDRSREVPDGSREVPDQTRKMPIQSREVPNLGFCRCPMGQTKCPIGQQRCPMGQEKCPIGQARCPIRQAKCPISLGRCPIWNF